MLKTCKYTNKVVKIDFKPFEGGKVDRFLDALNRLYKVKLTRTELAKKVLTGQLKEKL